MTSEDRSKLLSSSDRSLPRVAAHCAVACHGPRQTPRGSQASSGRSGGAGGFLHGPARRHPRRRAAQGVLANDTDPLAKPLTAILVTSAAHGTLGLNPDGGFTYVNDGPPRPRIRSRTRPATDGRDQSRDRHDHHQRSAAAGGSRHVFGQPEVDAERARSRCARQRHGQSGHHRQLRRVERSRADRHRRNHSDRGRRNGQRRGRRQRPVHAPGSFSGSDSFKYVRRQRRRDLDRNRHDHRAGHPTRSISPSPRPASSSNSAACRARTPC